MCPHKDRKPYVYKSGCYWVWCCRIGAWPESSGWPTQIDAFKTAMYHAELYHEDKLRSQDDVSCRTF